ncbi:MAG TPA: LysM domain-containing protein, partial [Bryobacteraceae bacterium]
MAGQYTVKEGDYLSSIADQYGFSSHLTIWNDPHNADLKAKRKNPNILFPGDIVYIPDHANKIESRPTDQRHKFVTNAESLMLRLILERSYDSPLTSTPCELVVGTNQFKLTTDGDGLIEQKIPRSTPDALLIVKDTVKIKGADVPVNFQVPVKVGALDPVEEQSGQRTRLANLGYYRLDGDDVDDGEFRS